ncbi:MAG TPA: hemerythrin domain-containing protein [Frankiaceae bacterium]|nr:hemerythrin domain-containing protein [Frankiaceae bacterium]
MSDLDIVALVIAEHQVIRRSFASLQSLEERAELESTWQELADRLEVHASAEEEMLYPKLLRVADDDHEETDDAIRDHNEIRDTARAVGEHEAGSDSWWDAVRSCQEANEHHLDEEERDVLPDLKEHADQDALESLGEQWLAFHDEHDRARGLSGKDKDPEQYIEDNA